MTSPTGNNAGTTTAPIAPGGADAVLEKYTMANLIPFLENIRKPGRYAGFNGVNVLTNAAPSCDYNREEVDREMLRACNRVTGDQFVPQFTHPQQGFAYGLNPYTDWALKQNNKKPTHYYLFLGLDWYSISSLGPPSARWFDDPFAAPHDRYWHNLWAWILRKYKESASGSCCWNTPISKDDAATFIRADGGGFIFHNRIPYLRPAGYSSAGTAWYTDEWKKPAVRADAIEDLRVLRRQTNDRIAAICTGSDSESALREAGYDKILSWKAHPSRVFHPRLFIEGERWFPNCFRTVPTEA